MKKEQPIAVPDIELLEAELRRVYHKSHCRSVLRSTVFALILVAAVAVLVAFWLLPNFGKAY